MLPCLMAAPGPGLTASAGATLSAWSRSLTDLALVMIRKRPRRPTESVTASNRSGPPALAVIDPDSAWADGEATAGGRNTTQVLRAALGVGYRWAGRCSVFATLNLRLRNEREAAGEAEASGV